VTAEATWTERVLTVEAMRTGRGYSLAKHNAEKRLRTALEGHLDVEGVAYPRWTTLTYLAALADEAAAVDAAAAVARDV
jgi:hypothetical protein